MSLWNELLRSLSREGRRPAVRRDGAALDRSALTARIEARAEALGREQTLSLCCLDASDPIALTVDFFAARAAGRTAAVHADGIPPRLRQQRQDLLERLLPSRSDETIFFSSGSVSRGKAVPISEDRILFSALAYPERVGIVPSDRVAVAVPAGQIFGFVRGVVNTLLVGAEVVFLAPRRDPLGEAQALGATFVLLSPGQAQLSASGGGTLVLRGALTAGGPMAEMAAARLEADRGVPVRFGYGLTETTALASRQHFDRPRRPGSSGLPAPGMTISVVADDGSPAAAGETGEIRIAGPSVFRGYADPAESSPFDEQGRFRSGDLGFLDEAGEIHVRGRAAASIRAHGRFLCAEELEGAVLEKTGIAEAAAVPLGEAFGLLVVAEDRSESFLDDVRAHLSERLPLYARPRRLRRVERLPMLASGKLDRLAAARCFETS